MKAAPGSAGAIDTTITTRCLMLAAADSAAARPGSDRKPAAAPLSSTDPTAT